MERVAHPRPFLRFLRPDTPLNGSGMRPMRNTPGMQRDHPLCHILPAHEIPVDIIKQLVTIDIAVIIRSGNGQGMIVEQPRTERANHEVMSFKGLMDRRWLVDPAG